MPNVTPITKAPATAAPPFKIETAATREHYLKMMVYGDYGVGKTYLCGTSVEVPHMNDVILINAESGDLTLDSNEYAFGDIDRITCTQYRQIARVQEYLSKHCQFRDSDEAEAKEKLIEMESKLKGIEVKEPKRYRTVIIDSLGEVEAYCMYQLLGITEATKIDDETVPAEFKEYKQNFQMILRMVRRFRNLPMHVLMTCPRTFIQDEHKRFNFAPKLTGQLSSAVQGFMDVVGFLVIGQTAEEGKALPRKMYVQPAGRWAAKCRFSKFKGVAFENPSLKSILNEVGLLGQK